MASLLCVLFICLLIYFNSLLIAAKLFNRESLTLNMLLDISPLLGEKGSTSANDILGSIMLEKNGRTLDFFPGEVSTNRITALQVIFSASGAVFPQFSQNHKVNVVIFDNTQEAYWSMASALSEADGIDYTDPEEV